MSSPKSHFNRMLKYIQKLEDEAHRLYDDDHIEREDEKHMTNLSEDFHRTRQGIERTKLLILKGN